GSPGGYCGLLGHFFLIPAYLDMSQKNEKGEYDRWYGDAPGADPYWGVTVENPIWRQRNRDYERTAARTLANGNLRWSPFHWFNAVADLSFDREDSTRRTYVPKGIQDSNETYDGRIAFDNGQTDTFNGSLQGALRWDFGRLNSRTTLRGIVERVS